MEQSGWKWSFLVEAELIAYMVCYMSGVGAEGGTNIDEITAFGCE